ncbi:MAG: heparinase II/III family protein [Bacteroidaceae bacterium]
MKSIPLLSLALCGCLSAMSLQADEHPCYLTRPEGRAETLQLIEREAWAKEAYRQLADRTDRYVERVRRQPDWLLSRLAMYWHSHATDIYIKGETFDHAGGEAAPVPTVRYTGTRGTYQTHNRPRLEDVVPYDDDENGYVSFCNKALPGQPQERVHPSKTGRAIESLNREIMGIARDAAFLYWVSRDEDYARLAAGVFDTYMMGIYYRHVPVDLDYGHQQTLVGMSSFEVIHEDILDELVPLYDFLYDYLAEHHAEHMGHYTAAFKKWADNIIANGVPHNNWNLMQARYVMSIGLVLDDDARYADGKGRSYYVDYVLNRSSIRQWSLKRLADYGYDPRTGIWAECPGYSGVVLGDYTSFVHLFDRNLGRDLTEELPVIPLAVEATMQYLFPNGMLCGFGDTHPTYPKTTPVVRMIQNAQHHGKVEQEARFTALLKCLDPTAGQAAQPKKVRAAVSSFFEDKPLELRPEVEAGRPEDYVSALFHAPNVSWLVQRNGMDPHHSLMVSLNGSLGNHMHANGISMELYGKGYVMGPDAGIGLYLYSGLDYAEYYSQFPSHNTVCVDGISSYPVMRSNHAFRLTASFPSADSPKGVFFPATFSQLAFLEPETQADQLRQTGIVGIGETGGYYVDIFRSRKTEGGDKMHDYFYHNLGQTLTLTAADGTDLALQPTEELSFAGAHLSAYSYLYEKQMAETGRDVLATFTIHPREGADLSMRLWMKGDTARQVFTALAPMTEGYSRTPGMPYDIKKQPTLTYVARQRGEAWTHPFVAVFEPATTDEPGQVASVAYPVAKGEDDSHPVALRITLADGREDDLLSSDNSRALCRQDRLEARGAYALQRSSQGRPQLLMLAGGTWLKTSTATLRTEQPGSVLLEQRADGWYYTASVDARLTLSGRKYRLKATPTPVRL